MTTSITPLRDNPPLTWLSCRRCFFEAALTKASPLLGISVSTAAGHKKLAYTVLWSIRRSPIQFGASLRLGDSTKLGRSQKARLTSAKLGEENPLAPGDTLLLEADEVPLIAIGCS